MSVFLVDEGRMLPMDVDLAAKSVESVKKMIACRLRIPVENQVLLVNSGESLDSDESLCSYSSGTDSGPIYLYSNNFLEEDERPPIIASGFGTIELVDKKTQKTLDETYCNFREHASKNLPESYWASFRNFQKHLEVIRKGIFPCDTNLLSRIEESLCLPATYNTVINRAYLSKYLYEHDNCIYKYCKNVLSELHLQQHGWLAALSNLNASTQFFRMSVIKFEENYSNYLSSRKTHIESLNHQDIKAMDKTLLLPGLVSEENKSLYQWLSSKEKIRSIEEIAQFCARGLEQYNVKFFQAIQSESSKILIEADHDKMVKIIGLNELFSHLDQSLKESQNKVQAQKDHALMFQNNAQRAGDKANASILVDLCLLHEEHLLRMKMAHRFIYTILNNCIAAKEQLSKMLHIRLAWITLVQKSMSKMNNQLVFHSDNLKRLQAHLEILQQIHTAPELYLAAVTEVVRRKAFSEAYLQWSTAVSQQASELYKKETAQRKVFGDKINRHFVRTLFPGMDDNPPPFAIDCPKPFDANLPSIKPEDGDNLRQQFTHCDKLPITCTEKTDDGSTKRIEPDCAMLFSMVNLKECLPDCENVFQKLHPTHTHIKDSDNGGDNFSELKVEFEKIDAQFTELFGIDCHPVASEVTSISPDFDFGSNDSWIPLNIEKEAKEVKFDNEFAQPSDIACLQQIDFNFSPICSVVKMKPCTPNLASSFAVDNNLDVEDEQPLTHPNVSQSLDSQSIYWSFCLEN